MAKTLSIHTVLPRAIVSLSQGGELIAYHVNEDTRMHAAFLHEAIRQLLAEAGWTPRNLGAISVSIGPGSYTGIRVGLSAAKGLSYALKIPLIGLNTLEVMACTAIHEKEPWTGDCIAALQAREEEIFIAGYTSDMEEIMAPALIHPSDFQMDTSQRSLIITGDGADQLMQFNGVQLKIYQPENEITPEALSAISHRKYSINSFMEVADADAVYLKEAYVTSAGKKAYFNK